MSSIVKLFVIFFLNLIPAFAPPVDGLFLPEVRKSHFERRSVSIGRRRCGDVRQAHARETRPRSNPAKISQRCHQTKYRVHTRRAERKTKAYLWCIFFTHLPVH